MFLIRCHVYTYIHMYIYMYIYIYTCLYRSKALSVHQEFAIQAATSALTQTQGPASGGPRLAVPTAWSSVAAVGGWPNFPKSWALFPSAPNVPPLRALWSLLDGIWGVLKGTWGALVLEVAPKSLFPELGKFPKRTRVIL